MLNYKCDNCRRTFDEPDEEHTTYEDYCGVRSLFPNTTPMTLYVCPYCGSEDIEEQQPTYYDVMPGEPLKNTIFHKIKPKQL